MPRPCLVCTHPHRSAIEGMILAGASDYEVGRQFTIERVSVGRHRRQHVIRPAQDRLTIISKGASARREREELASAAASGTPSTEAVVAAAIGLQAQVQKLEAIEGRLERMASVAEAGQSPTGVATLAAQQLRGVEVGSRLAGIGAYAPQRTSDHIAAGTRFEISIVFSGANRTETISTTASPPIIDSVDIGQGNNQGDDRDSDDR